MGQQEKYIKDTTDYIKTVEEFCKNKGKWLQQREREMKKMKSAGQLGAVLKRTLEGLKTLTNFLDAVEKLAVTSLFVFDKRYLPEDMSVEFIQSMIYKARAVSPLLVLLKRDNSTFFRPIPRNVDILESQLHQYINVTKHLCLEMTNPKQLTQNMRNTMENMTDNLSQLSKIRMDECFRLTYLFNGCAPEFIETYSRCRSRMFQFLSDLEEAAVQLDKMKFRSSITTVVGSSLSIVASVLSLAGLALAPSTSGWSLSLTAVGLWLGVTSGVNSLVTGIFKAVIDYQQGSKTNDIFKDFMEDVQKVLDCIEKASSRKREVPHLDFKVLKNVKKYGIESCKLINEIKSVHDTLENLKSEDLTKASDCQKATKSCSIPSLAAECPDLGPLAKDTPLAISKTASIGNILTKSLSIGMDLYVIYKESISLFRGDKSEASELIHSRSTLLRSEIEMWGKIHDNLLKGDASYQKSRKIFE